MDPHDKWRLVELIDIAHLVQLLCVQCSPWQSVADICRPRDNTTLVVHRSTLLLDFAADLKAKYILAFHTRSTMQKAVVRLGSSLLRSKVSYFLGRRLIGRYKSRKLKGGLVSREKRYFSFVSSCTHYDKNQRKSALEKLSINITKVDRT